LRITIKATFAIYDISTVTLKNEDGKTNLPILESDISSAVCLQIKVEVKKERMIIKN